MAGGSGGQPRGNWAERMSPRRRGVTMAFLGLGVVFMLGAIFGFSVGLVEDGALPSKPSAYIAFAIILALGVTCAWALRTVYRAWQTPDLSPFDRRYIRMWAIIAALGVPLGIGVSLGIDLGDPLTSGSALFSNSPIDPTIAIILVIASTVALAAAAVLYHRTIDDHEERAYLWGSTIAFYFVALAFPVAWLLARGGLLTPLGIGQAMIILFISFVIQAAVWLWFKFR